MRHLWLILALLFSAQAQAQTQSCWQAEEIESKLHRQLAELRRTWMYCDPNRDHLGSRNNCFVDLGVARMTYTILPQNNDAISMESVRQLDTDCGTQMEAIYIAQAEAIEAIFGGAPVTAVKPEASEEIKQEVMANVIDPCYKTVIKNRDYGLPRKQRTKQTIEKMKSLQQDEIAELTKTIYMRVRDIKSLRERKGHYRIFRNHCMEFAFQNPLLPNRPTAVSAYRR